MDGKGSIRLNDRDYDVEKGGGIYLGPSETATIQAAAALRSSCFSWWCRRYRSDGRSARDAA